MEKLRRRRFRRRSRRLSLLFVLVAVVLFSGAIGSGLAQALHPPIAPEPALSPDFLAVEAIGDEFLGRQELEKELLGKDTSDFLSPTKTGPGLNPNLPPADPNGTVDPVPASYWLARDLYRENCGTCHLALPPATLPVQTWRELLTSEQHYGKVIQPPPRATTNLIWSYIRDYSRPLREEESIPYRLDKSRFFRSLHPDVSFPKPVRVNQCATCHPRAEFFNFRLFNNASQD